MLNSRDLAQARSGLVPRKRLGGYLVEAGLLTPAQVDVALNDQKITGMRFGEILAARGWVKQQTIEYLMNKVILPDREPPLEEASVPNADPIPHRSIAMSRDRAYAVSAMTRREIPIAKPLPSVQKSDGDVSWVG